MGGGCGVERKGMRSGVVTWMEACGTRVAGRRHPAASLLYGQPRSHPHLHGNVITI